MTKTYITVENGEILADQWQDTTDLCLTVAAGGTISNATLTYRVDSLTLEEGAIVSGTLTTAAPVIVGGELNAAEANIVWDISRYKLEEGLFWSDLDATGAASYSLMVSANQNKGTYRIAGNAADFDGTIRIVNSGGVELGTLSLAAPELDYDITRYTLAYNEAGELTVTISSNITDDCYYVFLYKDNQLVTPLEDGFNITVSGDGEYENLVVIDGGLVGNIELLSGGLLTVYAGGVAVGVDQASGGRLRFDYMEGDTTLITGANQYGSFLVENNVLSNVVGEYVNLSGNLFVDDYHSYGVFTSVDGVDITGTFVENNSYAYFRHGTNIHDCTLVVNGSTYNSDLVFEKGVTVTDSTINRGRFNGGDYYNVTVGSGKFYGGIFGESIWNGGCLYSYVALDGDLTINNTITKSLYGDGYLDADNNTITLNFRKRKISDGEILPGRYVSECADFILDLLVDQSIGTFQVLGSSDRCSKYSFTIRTDEGVLGTLTETNQSFEYGDYVYTMTSRKELVISLSPNADESFNVLYWDADDTFYHSVDLFGETASGEDYKQVMVRENGIVGDLILKSGGLLQVNTGGFAVGIDQQGTTGIRFDYAAGDVTILSGANQYGTFQVQDDVLLNVIGENVNLSGQISVQNYRSYGQFTATDGVDITGTFVENNHYAYFRNGTNIHDCTLVVNGSTYNSDLVFEKENTQKGEKAVTVTDSTINRGSFYGGIYTNVTISGGSFYGGTYVDCIWRGGTLRGPTELAGTLTITGSIGAVSNSVINANGNTIVLDYTNRTVTSGAMISIKNVSEDVVFQINLKDDQNVGTYTIASNAGSFVDLFHISVGGEIVGTLNRENSSFDYGNYSYAMGWDNNTQQLKLTIDISENADPSFNVLCYNAAGELYHQEEMTTIVVDGTDCAKVTVRKDGILANAKLNNGLMTVFKGATVYGLDQTSGGKLRFNYAEDDNLLITGVNQYGTFFVENNEVVNVVGENVTISGDVTVSEYHSTGSFRAENGVTITDTFYGNGTFVNSTVEDATVTGQGTVSGSDAYVYNSTFNSASFGNGTFDTVTVNGGATLSGGTYRELTLAGGGQIRGQVSLDGRLIIGDTVTCYSSYSVNGAIDANGHEVNLDLTDRDTIDERMINLNRVYNADLTCTVYANQTIGTYTLGSDAGSIGAGDGEGYWDIETNKWLYKNAIQGDLDGVITIRSDQGVELARCTVNGATEYFGRYNYRVYTDEDDNLKLSIGWNNRETIEFAADGYDNNTFETATALETAKGELSGLTIDSESDVDYFKFTLNSTGRLSSFISIAFDMWKGDLDMYLYNAQGEEIDYAKSVTDNEELSLHTLAAGDYYLKVVGDASVNEYELYWNLPDENSLVDANEKGNDKAHSYHLGKLRESVTVDAAISDANDEDWFMFILDDDGTSMDSISITFDDAEADLAFYIYGSNGKDLIGHGTKHRGHYYCTERNCHHRHHHHERYGQSHNHSGQDDDFTFEELYLADNEISLAGFKKGVYYVQVVSADGGATDYTLSANVYSGEVNPDKWENNDTMRRASNLYSLNGEQTISELSIHRSGDEDHFRFNIAEDGSVDDYIAITHEARLGDLDLEILDREGNVVAYSRTAENTDKVSLNGLAAGEYYIRVYGYENTVNNYSLETYFTNSALIPADRFEGENTEPVVISHSQTIDGLSLAKPVLEDETRADVFKIELAYDAWKSSKIILTDYRSDWDEGIVWKITSDAAGENIITEGQSSEISLYGLTAGDYYLTIDTPEENEYSEYSLIAQHIPDSTTEIENTWSIFVYIAGDNNLEECFMTELLYMQHAILPENVEVYVLMDRHEGYFVGERNWTDTRVGKIRHSPGGAVAVEWMYFDGVDTDTYMNTTNLELQQEWDTGDIVTLEAFLDWGMQTGRADNYALIMKDHGSSLGYNCSDDTSGSMLTIDEIADLLSEEKYDDLSVVAFDQCLMGSDVVVSELEGVVDYTVASEAIGWTPNLLVMYKVLFNSLETDMTPQELSEKIVDACNCSGIKDLTLSSFDTSDTYLSTALNEFANNSPDFTYADWAALCCSFGNAFNYGDSICAFSDLITILEETLTFTISTTLEDSVKTLLTKLKDEVITSTMITPETYGNGLAVYNPVLSSAQMSQYYYSGGGRLDYHGSTTIGQMAWGDFLYTVGALAEDLAAFNTADSGNLTFNDFYYIFGDENKELVIDLGAFTGAGTELEGMYITDSTPAHFDIRMFKPGVEGDGIRIVSDDPEANVTITLVQYLIDGFFITPQVRRISEDGFLSLEGVDFSSVNALSNYYFVVTSDKTTNYSMYYEGNWTTGVDRFDFARTGSIDSSRGGNNILDKATHLAPGNYAGLMTYAGDKDYYCMKTVYANTIDVTVEGSGLTVQEYDAKGNLIETAEYVDGVYVITVAKDNYLLIEGDADISANEVNSYVIHASDAASTYLAATLMPLPEFSVSVDTIDPTQKLTFSAEADENCTVYCSQDLINWVAFGAENTMTVATNGVYYFKVKDSDGLESKYKSIIVSNIDTEPPTAPTASADITVITNQNVIVSAVFSEDSVVKQYSLDNVNWFDYTGSITFKENGVAYFRGQDEAGNWSNVTPCVVNNIDTTAPIAPMASADKTGPTNQHVTVSAVFSADSVEKEYSLDNKTWMTYTDGIEFSANGTVYFRSQDEAGNYSETITYTVSNIDTTAPDAPAATADVTAVTNGKVVVSAAFSSDSVVKEYSLDNKTWLAYTAGIEFSANGTVYFRGQDEAGNWSTVSSYEVTNIDTIAPDAPAASANITTPTNQNVTVSAAFSSDSVVKEYSLDGKTWNTYSAAVKFTDNGTVYFRGQDEAGNWSAVSSYEVTNIDKVAPDAPTASANITTPTNQNVTVSATFDSSADVVLNQYSVDGINWITYPAQGVVMTEVGTVYFRSIDNAGNISEVFTCEVNNIDKTAPIAPTVSANITGATNQEVAVTAVFPTDAVTLQYRIGNGEWITFDANNTDNVALEAGKLVFTTGANISVAFRCIDAAGNISAASGYAVTNIDTVAPALSISGISDAPTNQNVVLNVTTSSDATLYYSLSGADDSWIAFNGAYEFTANGEIYFKAVDTAGNVTLSEKIAITNIDKTAPVVPVVTANTNDPTNQNVILTAVYSEDSVLKQYSFDGSSWLTYDDANGVIVSDNRTVYFKAVDAAGNVSALVSKAVTNIDTIAPDAPVASANITDPTNQKVTVSAAFSSDSVVKEYSLDNKTWIAYTAGVEFSANGMVYFRGQDEAGNWSSITTYKVSNIDKIAPDAPVATADKSTPTNQSVNVSAAFSSDSVVKQYSLDNKTWNAYTAAVKFTDNGTVYFRGQDVAGNWSSVTTYNVTNIDTIAPDAPEASANISAPTNQKVTVSATFSTDSVLKQYSLGNDVWMNYTSGIVFSANGTVYFRSQDEAGNWSSITTYNVTNIDKIAPDAPEASANITNPTNQNVTVSAVFSADSVVKQYSLDNKTWIAYTAGIEFSANGTVYFRGQDEAGNWSTVSDYFVKNIDKTPPATPVGTLSNINPTNQDITVTVQFGRDSVVKQYKIADGEWLDYTGAFVISGNTTIYFHAKDRAGNESSSELVISNIDKIIPELPFVVASMTTPTNQAVTVKAIFSSDSVVKQYSFDNTNWVNYTVPVEFTQNGTVYFRGQDEAGNYSETAFYEVTNIDTVAPDAPVATADKTGPTNQTVTISASFSKDSVKTQYSFDNTNWIEYTEGVEFEENGNIYFRGQDAAGNWSDVVSYDVINIDKESPLAPTATADTTAPTNQNVTVSATFSADSVVKEYSLDGKTWSEYAESIVFEENGMICFRSQDTAGNWSDVLTYEVKNIDKVAPEAPDASANITAVTNGKVMVSATFSADSVVKEYSLDGKNWLAYTNSVAFFSNGTVYFRGQDEAGNYSAIETYTVSNIDTEPPAKPGVSADITNPTNGKVVVSAAFSTDSVLQQYSFDKENWIAYTEGIEFEDNGVVYFRSQDEAGNFSTIASYYVSNIDKVAPVAPVAAADVTAATNKPVTVSAVFSEDTSLKEYSFDNVNWQTYSATGVVMQENGMVYFRGRDKAGNISAVTSYKVTNIYSVTSNENNNYLGAVDLEKADAENKIEFSDHVGTADVVDCYKFTLDSAAKMYFDVTSSDKVKFTLYTITEKGKIKKFATQSVKANGSITSKKAILEAGIYYIEVASTNKTTGAADYTVTQNAETVFFTKGNNADDYIYNAKTKQLNDMDNIDFVGRNGGISVTDGWVGYGDSIDYMRFTLDSAAKLSFHVDGTATSKFTICQLVENKNGTYKVKTLQTATVKLDKTSGKYMIDTKGLLLTAGDYFIGMTSTGAKKGDSVNYQIALNDSSEFFTEGIGGDVDDWTDLETKGAAGAVEKKGALTAETNVDGWVGFGDSVDYMEFTLDSVAKVSFDLESRDAAKFTVYQLVENKNGTFRLKALQNTVLKAPKGTTDYAATSKDLWLSDGTYYVSMTSTNAKKSGDADYSIKVSEKSYFSGHKADATDNTWKLVQNDEAVKLDGADINGWVGYSDAADFVKLELDGSGAIKLELDDITATAYEGKQLKITCVNEKGKAIALTYDAATDSFTSKLTFDEGTVCYVGVSTTNQKKFDTEYQITAGILA